MHVSIKSGEHSARIRARDWCFLWTVHSCSATVGSGSFSISLGCDEELFVQGPTSSSVTFLQCALMMQSSVLAGQQTGSSANCSCGMSTRDRAMLRSICMSTRSTEKHIQKLTCARSHMPQLHPMSCVPPCHVLKRKSKKGTNGNADT